MVDRGDGLVAALAAVRASGTPAVQTYRHGTGDAPTDTHRSNRFHRATPAAVNNLQVPASEQSITAEPALASTPTLKSWLETAGLNSAASENPAHLFVEAFRALEQHIRDRLGIDDDAEAIVVYDPSISQPSRDSSSPLSSSRWINRRIHDASHELTEQLSRIAVAIREALRSCENSNNSTARSDGQTTLANSLHPIHIQQIKPVVRELADALNIIKPDAFDRLPESTVIAIIKATHDTIRVLDAADRGDDVNGSFTSKKGAGTQTFLSKMKEVIKSGIATLRNAHAADSAEFNATWDISKLPGVLKALRGLDSLLRSQAVPLGELYVEIPKDISPASRSIVLSLFDHPTKRVNDGVSAIITVTLGYQSKDPQLVDGTFVDPKAGWQITSFLGPKCMSDLLMSGGIPLHTPFRAPEGAARDAWLSRQVGDAAGPLMRALEQVGGSSKLPVAPEEKYAQLMGVIGVVLQTQLGIDSPSSENPLAGIVASLSAGLTHGSPAAQLQYERAVSDLNTQLGDALGIPYQQRVTISAAPQQLSNWRQIAEQGRATNPSSIESVRLAAIEWLEGYCRKQLEIPESEDVVLGSTESGTGGPADAGEDGRFGLPHLVRFADLYPEFSRPNSRLQTIKLHSRPGAVGDDSSTPVVMIAMYSSAENSWRICALATGAGQTQTQQQEALAFTGLVGKDPADYTLSTN